MSKVKIEGNASGTGTFTIAAPNSSTDRTLTLPDEAGTVLTSTSDIAASQIVDALNAGGSAPIYACRAWVNFNGTGTVAIRASGNVSSITDVGTGEYQANFATAMPDTNYSSVGSSNRVSSTEISTVMTYNGYTNYVIVETWKENIGGNSSATDSGQVYVAVFR